MGKYNIPDSSRGFLEALGQIEDEEFNEFSRIISKIPEDLSLEKCVSYFDKEIRKKNISLDAEECLRSLYSMSVARVKSGVVPEEFASGISDEFMKSYGDLYSDMIPARLLKLLSSDVLVNYSKAKHLQTEYGNVYGEARVVSDIRPVFDECCEKLVGSFVVHNMKIEYVADGEVKEHYFALNSDDLTELRKTLERAEKKGKDLKKFIDGTEVQYYA